MSFLPLDKRARSRLIRRDVRAVRAELGAAISVAATPRHARVASRDAERPTAFR